MSGLICIQSVDTMMVYLKEFFKKNDFEKKSADDKKNMQNYPVGKELKKLAYDYPTIRKILKYHN